MSPEKPTLSIQELLYSSVSERELDTGLEWAGSQYEKEIDRNLLRLLVNTANERRTSQRRSRLPDIVGQIVREGVPLSNKEEAHKRAAYTGAVMKIFADRSAWKSRRAAAKRKGAKQVKEAPHGSEKHPEDARPRFKGQFKIW